MISARYIFQTLWILGSLECTLYVSGAVVPPPWANPKLNPCASQPRGWQLLYWPPDGKCYKIFQMGHPCPDDMELSPAATGSGNQQELSAECKCPPKTAQSARDGRCYELFGAGPCEKGYYFAPDTQYVTNATTKRQWGVCKQVTKCENLNEVFWPKDGKCYEKLTRGPCPKGQLLTVSSSDKLATCKCNNKHELGDFFYGNHHGCFQHFTKGPCKEKGHLFLPDKTCGCHKILPHYHEDTELCFEIGTIGPCDVGEHFQLDSTNQKATCSCKKGYIRYENGTCYRPYTQGPCPRGEILVNTTSCITQPCHQSHLYFPATSKCYRIGTRGPCDQAQVVTFDFETRPSIDGISYNGVCGCEKDSNCSSSVENSCDFSSNNVVFRDKCYKLYTQGPCSRGAWLIPRRRKKEIWSEGRERREGYCDCMPGYTKMIRTSNNRIIAECLSPTVRLADYLNKNFFTYSHADSA